MGYDICRFKSKDIDREFICGICQDVLKNPLVINPCEHIYCSDCIAKWMEEQGNCPIDRNKVSNESLYKPFRSFMNLLNRLEISCEYSTNGCERYLPLDQIEVHIEKCVFKPKIVCECGQQISAQLLIEHQNNCLKYLRKQLNESLELVKAMNKINAELKTDLEEAQRDISIFTEFESDNEIKLLNTNMSKIMIKRLFTILYQDLSHRSLNLKELSDKFCKEFGGNWIIFYGRDLCISNIDCNYYIICRIGKYNISITMSVKPVNDILIVEKLVKKLEIGVNNKVWNEEFNYVWNSFWNLSDDSFNISERLLDYKIMDYFFQCFEIFAKNGENIFNPMVGVFANISEFKELRHRLMRTEFISIISELAINQNKIVSYLSTQLLANILSEGKDFWKLYIKDNKFDRNLLIERLKSITSVWDMSMKTIGLEINFTTFKPFNRLLECNVKNPQEVNYFAVWTLAYFTQKETKRYFNLIKEDNCLIMLEKLINYSKTEDYVKKLAKTVVNNYQLFLINETKD